MKRRIPAVIAAIFVMNLMTAAVYADEITWQGNIENGRIEKNSTDEEQPAEVNDWGGEDFVAKEEPSAETGEEDSASKGMSTEQAAAAALAAAAAGKGLKGAKAVDKGEAIAKTLNVVRKPLAKNESKQFKATAKGIKKASKGKADKAVEVAKGGKTGKGTLYTVDTGDFSYNADGTSNKLGGWIMKKSDIEGLTSVQIADKYALPKEPTHICDINLDSEFSLQTGISNSVKEWGKGGGQQFDTMGKIFDEDAFVNEKLIGE